MMAVAELIIERASRAIRRLRPSYDKRRSRTASVFAGHHLLSNATFICYGAQMANQSKAMGRRTTLVPVTTMEEIPVLSDRERAELTTALEEAEARVEAGDAVDYEPKTFKDRLIGIYRRSKR
jgi:hypothetical protein